MREVEKLSRRVKDIVRNRNYRQAINVIEREVKRLKADDKPRARVRFPRDDGDIEIDVEGIIEFAQAMKPKTGIEIEGIQDGEIRIGIKTGNIVITGGVFVDFDEDGKPKGFGGTIDNIIGDNVTVYFGECEQSMSVTTAGKTVTFTRNVCKDDTEKPSEGDEIERSDEIDNEKPPKTEIPRPPAGYSGSLVNVFLIKRVTYIWGLFTDLTQEAQDFILGDKESVLVTKAPISTIQFPTRLSGYQVIIPLGITSYAALYEYARAVQLSKGSDFISLPINVTVKRNYRLTKADSHYDWDDDLPSTMVQFLYFSRFPDIKSKNVIVRATWTLLRDPETDLLKSEHMYIIEIEWEVTHKGKIFYVYNYKPEPPPSLPIMRDEMNKECCDDLLKMTREIHKSLGVRKLLDKSFQVPSNMMIPEGKGNHQNKDYLEIMSDLFKTIDNYGFNAPVTVTVQDTNKAQKGDQSIKLKFNSLGAILKAQTELLIELKGDSANRLNIQVRLAYMMTRMYRTLAKLYYRTSAILDGLGIPIISKVVTLPIEFNVFGRKHWGAGQGFGKENKKGQEPKLDLNDEDTTESMLPDLLEIHDYEIEVDEFRTKSNDLYEILIGIATKLKS